MEEEIWNLKQDRENTQENYSRKIAILQESLASKVNETDRKLAETQLKS
jgi:hypothetical protein